MLMLQSLSKVVDTLSLHCSLYGKLTSGYLISLHFAKIPHLPHPMLYDCSKGFVKTNFNIEGRVGKEGEG